VPRTIKYDLWYRCLDALKAEWPLTTPVCVRLVGRLIYSRIPDETTGKKHWQAVDGDCTVDASGHKRSLPTRIRVYRDEVGIAIQTLLHEWAHALSWKACDEDDLHSDEFEDIHAALRHWAQRRGYLK